jgi:hypothetical protein
MKVLEQKFKNFGWCFAIGLQLLSFGDILF